MKRALAGREFDVAFDISAYTTQALVPAVEALEGQVGRYVYISSIAVYEPTERFPIWETHPLITEPPIQFSEYAWGKIECESYLRERGLAGAAELYRHFLVRMNEIVKRHGKKTIVSTGTKNLQDQLLV